MRDRVHKGIRVVLTGGFGGLTVIPAEWQGAALLLNFVLTVLWIWGDDLEQMLGE